MNPRTLVIQDVRFRWPAAPESLFSDISLELEAGTVTALMGANGSGKTTLLEVITCRLAAQNAAIRIGDAFAKPDDFNYLPQDSNRLLFAHLTLGENIALQRTAAGGVLPPIVEQLFGDIDTLFRYPAQCSGGQRQRAAICRSILDMPRFPVTVLDESFSHLSRDAKGLLGPALLAEAKRSGAIVLFATHDLFDAMRFGNRVLTLANGRISDFTTSDFASEEECWKQVSLRDKILRTMYSSEPE